MHGAGKRKRRGVRHENVGYLFILPNLLGFIVLTLAPVLFSLLVSFTNWNLFGGLTKLHFIGVSNFVKMWSDVWFISSIQNNLIFTLGVIPTTLVLALLAAVVLNGDLYGRSVVRTMFFVPYISNIVAVSAIWLALYNPDSGPINQLLTSIGVHNPPGWIASTQWALPAIMFMAVWGGVGYNAVIYLAGLQAIPNELYEAARLDGTSGFQRLRYITIPMLSPTTFFLLVTDIIGSFQVFGQINIMTEGGPVRATTVIAYYIYQAGFAYFKMGYAASMAWFLFAGIFLVTFIQWRAQKQWVTYL